MILRSKSIFFILLLCPLWLLGQYSNTIHYTVKDGLPSSTVYSAVQDSMGFIWLGTEAGLVRFDGAKFKVYTTQDGLPDNEVLGLLFDSITNRLWIITYSKEPCYFKNGKIFTKQNDTSLSIIKTGRSEFLNGNLQANKGVYLYNGNVIYSCFRNTIKTDTLYGVKFIYQVRQNGDGTFDVLTENGIDQYQNGISIKEYNVGEQNNTYPRGDWVNDVLIFKQNDSINIYKRDARGDYRNQKMIPISDGLIAINLYSIMGESLIVCQGSGVYLHDTTAGLKLKWFYKGSVNSVFVDKELNLWISTKDNGLIVMHRQELLNFDSENGLEHDNVSAIGCNASGQIFIGNTSGEIYKLNGKSISRLIFQPNSKLEMIRELLWDNEMLYVVSNKLLQYDGLTLETKEIPQISAGAKSIIKHKKSGDILYGQIGGVLRYNPIDTASLSTKSYFKFHPPVVSLIDTIGQLMRYFTIDGRDVISEEVFLKRIITMAEGPNGEVYCGSLDGIYKYSPLKLIPLKNIDKRLNKRISSLAMTKDNLLWVGTASDGVLIFDGKRVLGHINSNNYMAYHGAICRKIICGLSGEVWIATNSGVDRISYHYSDSLSIDNVTPLNTSDGLLSDDVNSILLRDSMLYVATAHGLSVLNVKELSSPKPIPVYIVSLRINDKDSSVHDGKYELTYSQNNIQIQYIGVSLLAGGDIRYQYRLIGSSDKWETTTNTAVELRSISPGDYKFEVAVLDKFGNRSNHKAYIKFHISPAFYKTIWFWSLIFLSVLTTGFFVIRNRFKVRQKQYEKEQLYNNKIIDLEQQALKAQMNPHFIFNCLTAIQHFVNKEDVYSANMYLSNFAKLIRKTLDLSGEQYITLDKEVSYLENYIQLEKMRFQNEFNYFINVSEAVDVFSVQIPPMLLQPIIENAIRHGLRYKEDNQGVLNIDFSIDGSALICKINDNGIGIKRSRELKSNTHVEYQSKGMKLTESRINAINMISERKIYMQVTDKYDEMGTANGTLVVIKFEQ